MFTFIQTITLILIVALSILGGVMIGAFVVFKTKREGHESFIGSPAKGEVFSIDTFDGADGGDMPEEKEMPKTFRAASFMEQFTNEKS